MTVEDSSALLGQVLKYRQLQYAGQLFSLPDYDILTELYPTVARLKEIFNDSDYLRNANDQSLVELVLFRITAAIRDTCCIETYAAALVDVLEACLAHRACLPLSSSDGLMHESPHCKIALELLSTLFLYHSKKSVMTLAIPVAIKALNNANPELVRSTSSYLSLAAIHNGRILAQYSIQIIANVLNGNSALIRILPQLYGESREPFHAHLTALLRLLRANKTEVSEKLCLLQLASMITNTKPDLIVPHLFEFEDFLLSGTTRTAVLHIFLSLISVGRADCLVGQLSALRRAGAQHASAQNSLATIGKIVGVVGRGSSAMAAIAVPDLVALSQKANAENLPILLKEIEGITELFPQCVRAHIDAIRTVSQRQTSTHATFMRIHGLAHGNKEHRRSRLFESVEFSDAELGKKSPQTQTKSDSKMSGLSANIFDTISGKFIDSAESLCNSVAFMPPTPPAASSTFAEKKAAAHRNSTASSNFPSDPFPPHIISESGAMNAEKSYRQTTSSLAGAQPQQQEQRQVQLHASTALTASEKLAALNSAASNLDRNMRTLASAYGIRPNGGPLALANRSLGSLTSHSRASAASAQQNALTSSFNRKSRRGNENLKQNDTPKTRNAVKLLNGCDANELITFHEEPHVKWLTTTTTKPQPQLIISAEPPSYEASQRAAAYAQHQHTSQLAAEAAAQLNKTTKATAQQRKSALDFDAFENSNLSQNLRYAHVNSHHFDDNFEEEMLLKMPVQMGKDGRVRPILGYKHRNFADWLAKAQQNDYGTNCALSSAAPPLHSAETIFPVNAAASVRQKTHATGASGTASAPTEGGVQRTRVASGNGSASKIFVDEHQSAKRTRSNSGHAIDALSRSRNSTAQQQISGETNWADRGDVVKQFVENRKAKILRYITEFNLKYPIPNRCTVERPFRGRGKMRMRVHFSCQIRDPNFCVFDGLTTHFNFKSKLPAVWMHLMFLQMEAHNMERFGGAVLSQQSAELRSLEFCWRDLPASITRKRALVTLLTSAFPTQKEQSQLLKELQEARYFDSFSFNAQSGQWACFGCAHPEKVRSILWRVAEGEVGGDAPLLEGQLKEKKSAKRWRFFRRWHTRYFTLNSATLTSTSAHANHNANDQFNSASDKMIHPSIDLRKIRSVKSVSRGRKSRKSLPRAFELFTDDNKTLLLKANDRKKAEEWFQCLQIAVAQAQKHDPTIAAQISAVSSSAAITATVANASPIPQNNVALF